MTAFKMQAGQIGRNTRPANVAAVRASVGLEALLRPRSGQRYLIFRYTLPCTFRHLAQRAFWAATILLRAAGDIVRPLRPTIEKTFCPLLLAHRARWAAAIRARPAAEIVLLAPWLPVPISTESA